MKAINKDDKVLITYVEAEVEAIVLAKHDTTKPLPYFIKILTGVHAGQTTWCNRSELKNTTTTNSRH